MAFPKGFDGIQTLVYWSVKNKPSNWLHRILLDYYERYLLHLHIYFTDWCMFGNFKIRSGTKKKIDNMSGYISHVSSHRIHDCLHLSTMYKHFGAGILQDSSLCLDPKYFRRIHNYYLCPVPHYTGITNRITSNTRGDC